MAKGKLLIWWGYIVEWILSGLLLLLTNLLFEREAVTKFVRVVAIDVATLFCAIILAGSLAFLWTLYSKADTEFYQWLDERQGLSVYSSATAYVVTVSALSTLFLVVTKHIEVDWLAFVALFLLFLTAINTYTQIQNVLWLMRLNALFNQIKHKQEK